MIPVTASILWIERVLEDFNYFYNYSRFLYTLEDS